MVGAGKTLGRKFFEELVSAFRVSECFRKNAILRSNFPCLKKTHGLLQKIQAMYFKIQGTYFKICALYFLRK